MNAPIRFPREDASLGRVEANDNQAYADMCQARRDLLAAMGAWAATGPAPSDAVLELDATDSALRQVVVLSCGEPAKGG